MENENYKSLITNEPDYRHLADRDRYRRMYEEVGNVEANKIVRWREEWMKYFDPGVRASILELGAHNGPNLLHYGRNGHFVTGVEISSTLIKTFEDNKKLESEDVQKRINMHFGWIEEFAPSRLYDYILVTEVLEHVSDPVVVLKKAAECVKKTGTIYISSPATLWGNNTHVRGVPPADLEDWLQSANLKPYKLFIEDNRTFCFAKKQRASDKLIHFFNQFLRFFNKKIVAY